MLLDTLDYHCTLQAHKYRRPQYSTLFRSTTFTLHSASLRVLQNNTLPRILRRIYFHLPHSSSTTHTTQKCLSNHRSSCRPASGDTGATSGSGRCTAAIPGPCASSQASSDPSGEDNSNPSREEGSIPGRKADPCPSGEARPHPGRETYPCARGEAIPHSHPRLQTRVPSSQVPWSWLEPLDRRRVAIDNDHVHEDAPGEGKSMPSPRAHPRIRRNVMLTHFPDAST